MTREEAIAELEQSIRELAHAVDVGPRWFTKGREGQMAHIAAWQRRADAAWEVIEGDTAREIIIDDEGPVSTGLLDQHGNPLYRVVERVKMGFVK